MPHAINDDEVQSATYIRERLKTGIDFVDDIVTRLTGKAYVGQKPSFAITPEYAALVDVALLVPTFALVAVLAKALVAVASLSAFCFVAPALLVSQLLFVGRLRVLQVGHGHYAVHRAYRKGNPKLNAFIAHVATILPVAQNPDAYKVDHVDSHHRRSRFATLADPDAALVFALGFQPGMSRAALYRNLARKIFSPHFHGSFLMARLHSNFVQAPIWRKIIVAAWIGVLVISAVVLGMAVGMLAVVVPFVILYQVSALLQFLTEHRWMAVELPRGDDQAYADCSHARIALAPLPPDTLSGAVAVFAWLGWGIRQSGELLFRTYVTVGDLSVHDFHHLHGLCRQRVTNWTLMAFERQAAIDAGDPLKLAERETVGFRAAFDWVFDGLAESSLTAIE